MYVADPVTLKNPEERKVFEVKKKKKRLITFYQDAFKSYFVNCQGGFCAVIEMGIIFWQQGEFKAKCYGLNYANVHLQNCQHMAGVEGEVANRLNEISFQIPA